MEWQQFHFPVFLSNLHDEKDGVVWLFFNPFLGMPKNALHWAVYSLNKRGMCIWMTKIHHYIWNTFVGKFRWEGKGNAGKA